MSDREEEPREEPAAEWFATFFDEAANDFWAAAIPPEHTDLDVDLLVRSLGLTDRERVVDIAAGRGRLAVRLARRGVRVVALDYSRDGVDHLARHPGVAAVRADMRALPFNTCFDGGYCMGNSFGYFDLAGVRQFLHDSARVLKEGARFVLESATAAESLLPSLAEETTHDFGGVVVVGHHHHDPEGERLISTLELRSGGERSTRVMTQLVLSSTRIAELVTASGFEVEHLLGDIGGAAYDARSSSLIVVARRLS
jgi:SAM-dependent methyltransferase